MPKVKGSTSAPDIDRKKQRKPPKHKLTPGNLIPLATANPNLTTRQLGKLLDVGHTAIVEAFKRYDIKREHLDNFKANRADILAGIQETVAASLTEEDIKNASIRDRTMLFGVLYDKERLERGQATPATSIVFNLIRQANESSDTVTVEVHPQPPHE